LVAGGERYPDGLGGYFVRPTLFHRCHREMTIARDEIFGPALYMLNYHDKDEAVAIANNYGLTSYAF
jgi:aldehyde dehydrogenase (NAD+)